MSNAGAPFSGRSEIHTRLVLAGHASSATAPLSLNTCAEQSDEFLTAKSGATIYTMLNVDELRLTPEQRERAIKRGLFLFPEIPNRRAEAERTKAVARLYAALPRTLRRSLLDLTGLDGHRVRHHVRNLR